MAFGIVSIALALPSAGEALLRFDFNEPGPWPGATNAPVGTIDSLDSSTRSGGQRFTFDPQTGGTHTSGLIPVKCSELNLAKLTVSFDHSVSVRLLFLVRFETFDASKKRSGALETTLYPASTGFYQRAAFELSTLKPAGDGTFNPTDPFIQISFSLPAAGELHLDNFSYSTPAFYVSPDGGDGNDGRTEATAFASPQKALDMAQAGDIILLKNGTYQGSGKSPIATFRRPGSPAAWITLKNFPGHRPLIAAEGRDGVRINWGERGTPEEIMAYQEVRGLHIRGDGDQARQKYPDELGTLSDNTNARGISVSGRRTPYPGDRTPKELVHHIRLADNLIEYCAADGIYAQYADWFYAENNRIFNNCWATIGYAPSGFAVMGYANFDLTDNVPKMLISGNHVSGNKLILMNNPWGKPVKTRFYNGNGIILDANAEKPPAVYLGRTLVQNNLVHHNGAAGIQTWGNHRMDICNNTIYQNGTVVAWGQIGFERTSDVNLVNNIIVGRPETALDTWYPNRSDKESTGVTRINNLYFSGIGPPIAGQGDLIAEPLFVNASEDPSKANFRLKSGSPGLKAGRPEAITPTSDIAGTPRPIAGNPDLGAYQKQP